jgi:hypothetical protein
MKKRLMAGLLSAGLVAAMPPGVATAEDSFECGPGIISETFTDTLVVPSLMICSVFLTGDEVPGNMEVGYNASLHVKVAIVKGDVALGSRSRVYLDYSTLYGDISCSDDPMNPSRVFLGPGTVVVGDIDENCVIGYK